MLVESLALAEFVNQPQIFLVFNEVKQFANVFTSGSPFHFLLKSGLDLNLH